MKISTKINLVLLFAVSMFFTTSMEAQDNLETKNYDQKFKLGIGINAGTVFDEPFEYSLGADARLQYDLTKKYSITLTTGFSNLFVNGKNNDLGFIPVKAGFKAFIFKDTFYLMGEIGGAFAVTNDYDKSSLLLAPSIGYATKYIDISLRYEHYNDFQNFNNNKIGTGVGQLGLRLAYGFEL